MLLKTQILFEEPLENKNAGYPYYGASPKFIEFLKGFFAENASEIISIKLAIYLFNNFELHKTFIGLAEKGVKIDVVSIPLEGYDDISPQEIQPSADGFAFKQKQTKKSLATYVYDNFRTKPVDGYRLFIFPHTYIRSPKIKPFSRGEVPYSLHTKSMFIEMKGGKNLVGIFSSNLAMRDLPKYDFFVLREASETEAATTKHFFNHLLSQSVPVCEFAHQTNSFDFPIKDEEYTTNPDSLFFAPFYRNSPERAEKAISDLFLSAKDRIWVTAQHISAFHYNVPLNFRIKSQTNAVRKREGCLAALLRKGREGVEIKCLSQTYVDDGGLSDQKFREPVNTYNFRQFIGEFKKLPNAGYAVNENIHSKYIIVDDTVIATTFNYTPTQFISLPYVEIDGFENIPGLTYKGVFSEVGHLLRLERGEETEMFVNNFMEIWGGKETVVVK
jgi:hypothetical protein